MQNVAFQQVFGFDNNLVCLEIEDQKFSATYIKKISTIIILVSSGFRGGGGEVGRTLLFLLLKDLTPWLPKGLSLWYYCNISLLALCGELAPKNNTIYWSKLSKKSPKKSYFLVCFLKNFACGATIFVKIVFILFYGLFSTPPGLKFKL